MEITIRSEKPEDAASIREMIKRTLNRPDEARLVDTLRNSGNITCSCVIINNSTKAVVAYAAVSPLNANINGSDATGGRITPLLVDSTCQGQGLGSKLIATITEMCDQANLPFIMVMGNPNLYSKFDFAPAATYNLKATGDMGDSFLLRKGPGFQQPTETTTAYCTSDFELLDHSRQYDMLIKQFDALRDTTKNIVSRMSTLAALLHNSMAYNSWTGFYLYQDDELIVGPFQGPVACLKLKKDTGVCWHALNSGESTVVGNVHDFPGHIACDASSCSEVVVPCYDKDGRIYAVLDIDSYEYNAYNQDDAAGLEKLVKLLVED